MLLSSLTLTFFTLTAQIPARISDPAIDHQTITTPHFYIHFDPAIRPVAEELAALAEPVYERLTKLYNWQQFGRTHIVLTDTEATANGFSTPIPYNLIYLFPVHPEENTALDQYDDWLMTLFTHEFTHSVHIDKATGFNQFLRYLFGRIVLPNAAQQQWAIEGLAIYEETKNTSRGRGRSWYQQMFLRSAALENRFITIDRGTYWNDEYPFGSSAYWYGAGFYEYLAKIYGEEKIYQLVDATSDAIVPFFQNFKTDSVFGKSFHRLWEEWRASQQEQWNAWAKKSPPSHEGIPLRAKDFRLTGRPAWTPDGKTLFANGSENERPKFFQFTAPSDPSAGWTVKTLKTKIGNDFAASADRIVYSQTARKPTKHTSRFYSTRDLWSYDLKTEKSQQLTSGFRLKDPSLVGNRVVAVDTFQLKPRLVTFLINDERKDPLEEPSDLEVLFQGQLLESISSPSLDPSGTKIVFSYRPRTQDQSKRWISQNRDLYLLDLTTKKVRPLTDTSDEEHEPQFSPTGNSVYFTMARPQTADVPISNLYELPLTPAATPVRLSQTLTGAFHPATRPAPKDKSDRANPSTEIAFGLYTADGLRLRLLTKKLFDDETSVTTSEGPSAKPKANWSGRDPIPTSDPASVPTPTDYRMGSSLLPRFFFPFFLASDSETYLGAQTGSYDPLMNHSYLAFGYHSFTPNRPGGGLVYRYAGFSNVTLFAQGSAGISNYGRVLGTLGTCIAADGTQVIDICSVNEDYYERLYSGSLTASFPLAGSDFGFSLQGFFNHRGPLLAFPTLNLPPNYLVNGTTPISETLSVPQRGWQWGGRFSLFYASNFKMYDDSIAPVSGQSANLTLEYTPNRLGSEHESFTTVLTGKTFFETWKDVTIAASGIAGLQWLDPVFQRSFRLGGAFPGSQYTSGGYRTFPLRGLPSQELQGEGVMAMNLELRAPLLRRLPGLGTAPLWLKDFSFAFFSDGGQAFQWNDKKTLIEARLPELRKKFALDRFSLSTGLELRSQVSITYAPPLTARLGYGRTILLKGENVFTESGFAEIYALLGTSF